MKKVNKAEIIRRAFFSKMNMDVEEIERRRGICETCPFNSKHVPTKNMSFINKARKKTLKNEPFCTACNCQIKEKTASPLDECGLVEKGEPPKWNRIILETTDKKEIKIVNKSPKVVNVDITKDGDSFEVDFGEVHKLSDGNFKLELTVKEGLELDVVFANPSCKSCTTVTYIKESKSKTTLNGKVDFSKMLIGTLQKYIYLNYDVNGKNVNNTIKLIGEIKE